MKRSPLFSIFLIVLIDILGFTIILPLLPFYAEQLGATPLVVGWLLSSYGICQFVAGPVLGQISDRIGRKPVLLLSQGGTLIGFLILAFSTSLLPVFISRVIDGLTAGNISVAQAYISDVTEPEKRAKSFGLIGIAFGFGFLVGPALAGLLAHFGHQYPIFAAAGLSAASIVATSVLLPSSKKAAQLAAQSVSSGTTVPKTRHLDWKSSLALFKEPELGSLLWQFFAFICAFGIFFSGFALFAERRYTHHAIAFGTKEVGYVFAYVGLLGMIIQGGLIGRLVKKFGESRLVQAGFVFMAVGFVYLSGTFDLPNLLAAVSVMFFGMSVLRPSLTSLITQKAGRHRQGIALGMTQSFMSISQILMPFISGALIHHRLLTWWAWTGVLASGCGWLLWHFRPDLSPAPASRA